MQSATALEKIVGRDSEVLTDSEFIDLIDGFSCVELDLGTGDAMFAYRRARKNPQVLVIGVDLDRSSLAVASRKASRKPSRGGCSNLLCLCHDAVELPVGWTDLAEACWINFPWGRLLEVASLPQPDFLEGLRRVLKDGARLTLHLNAHVFDVEEQRASLQLPTLDEEGVRSRLLPAYERHGLIPIEWSFPPPERVEVPSTWGGRLLKGSRRPTFALTCRVTK